MAVNGINYFTITIQSSQVDADLTDYVVYQDLSDLGTSHGFWSNVATDGSDIRVTKADGTTEVPFELVSIDTVAKTGELHFKATGTLSSTSNTEFRVYYNSSDTAYSDTATYGRNNVWSDYYTVNHLESIDDSSGNNSPTKNGSTNVTGQIGDGQGFDGTDDYISIGNLTSFDLSSDFSVSFWIKTTTTGFHAISGSLNDGFTTQISITTGEGSLGGDVRIFVRDEGNNWIRINTDDSLINTGSFVRVKLTKSGNTASDLKCYVNGSEATLTDTSNSGTFTNPTSLQYPLSIGARNLRGTYDQHIPADIDEFSIANYSQSSNYAKTEYNNQNSPSTFYTLSADQSTLEHYTLESNKGNYITTGKNAQILGSYNLNFQKGVFTYNSKDSNIHRQLFLRGNKGVYGVQDKNFKTIRQLLFDNQKIQFTLSGKDVSLIRSILLKAEADNFTLSSKALEFLRELSFQLNKGNYTISVKQLEFLYQIVFVLEKNQFSIVGRDTHFSINVGLFSGSFTIGGKDMLFRVITDSNILLGTIPIQEIRIGTQLITFK